MSDDRVKNLAIINNWWATLNRNNKAEILRECAVMLADDYILHDPSFTGAVTSAAAFIKQFEQNLAGIAEIKLTISDMFAAGDKVTSRGVFECLVVESNERTRTACIVISRFEDGKLKEEWQILAPSSPAWD